MNTTYFTLEELKKCYPDEWVLLGNPKMQDAHVVGGIVLYHSKDKREVCYRGRDKTAGYDTVTIAFAGNLTRQRKVGILRRL